jgi:uncharacterized protein
MTMPFSTSRLEFAVSSDRRPPPSVDGLIEPQRVIEQPRRSFGAAGGVPDSRLQAALGTFAEAGQLQPSETSPVFQAAPVLDMPVEVEPSAPAEPPPPAPSTTPGYPPDRRLDDQPANRMLGKVIAVNGARATIATRAETVEHLSLDAWSIGKLISINLGSSRIVGMVYEMTVQNGAWSDEGANQLLVEVELVGEVVDDSSGRLAFRRGIATYPWLGATAHRIRSADLRAVFDLGERAGVEIGRVSQDESIAATVSIDDLLSKHFAVVGTTGVGKSSAVSLLVRKATDARPDLRVLVLDPHNEYAHAFNDRSITLDVGSLDLPVWLFRFDELVDVVYRGRQAPDAEADLLRELIPLAKAQFAAYSGSSGVGGSLLRKQSDGLVFSLDAPSPYRMLDVLGLLDEMMGKLDPRHDRYHMRVLKGRLESLLTDARYKFMFGKGATEDSLEWVIARIFRVPHDNRRITVLQLAGLPSEVLNAVVSVLARLSFEVAMWSGGDFSVLLLCEEAHRYVPQDSKLGFAPTRQAIARIAKEGRKYGCYIGVVTQRPGELDPTILSQCSTVFAMRLGNDRDQDIIRSAIADSSASQISFLPAIGNREAIAFGEGVATPMRMKFTAQNVAQLPSAGTGPRASHAGAPRPQTNLRTVVGKMRGQQDLIDH